MKQEAYHCSSSQKIFET